MNLTCLLVALTLAFAWTTAYATPLVTLAELEQAFREMTTEERRELQQAMSVKGYYRGSIDGAWRPSVAGGYKMLMASPEYLEAMTIWSETDGDLVHETLIFGTRSEPDG